MPQIRVGGQVLRLPDGASEDAIQAAIAEFKASPDFDKIIDKVSGAPARVRMMVGGASEQDKLTNLQRFYGDAQPYGEDNFVFTDPASGRPTLFNPKGLDVGDVAGVARDISVAAGSTLGAVAGATGGFLVGAPTGPGAIATGATGGVIGAGIGAATGGALFDSAADLIGGRTDTRNIGDMALDTALDFGGGALGQRVGDIAGQGLKALVGSSKNASSAIVQAFRSLRIEAPGGAVTGSKALQTVEKALESSPFSASIMQESAERVMEQTKEAATAVATSFGPIQTKQGVGSVIREASVKAAERFGFTQEKAYKEAFDLVGADTLVAVDSVTALRKTMEAELARAPESLGKKMTPAINQLKAIEADGAKGGIAFDALREVRTMIGKDLDTPMLSGATSSQNTAMKRVYGALTEDMSDAAKLAGPDAAKKLAVADRFTRQFMNTSAQTLEKINRFDADERAFEFVMTSAKDGGTALARLRRNFEPDEWDTVAGTVIGRMGLARVGAQDAAGDVFSPSTFLTNWNKLAPEAKKALFDGNRYKNLGPDLDSLVKVAGSLKEVEKLTNNSNTARNLIAFSAIQTFGAALGGIYSGDVEGAGSGAIATLLGTAVAPRYAAKLITNPSFVKWLVTPVTEVNGLATHIGRLAVIAEAEPAIGEEIDQFLSALRAIQAPEQKNSVPAVR